MSSSDAADADAGLPPDLVGERNTLRNLVGEVRRLLADRGVSDVEAPSVLDGFDRELADGPFTSASAESVRDRLGDLVGRAASGYFPGSDFIAWPRHRWADVGPHDWPPAIDPSPVRLSVNVARDAFGSESILLTNTRNRPVRPRS